MKTEADFEYRAPMISVDQIISPTVFAFKAVEVKRSPLCLTETKTIFPAMFVPNEMFCTQTVSLLSLRQIKGER